jgi:hypothetical protein
VASLDMSDAASSSSSVKSSKSKKKKVTGGQCYDHQFLRFWQFLCCDKMAICFLKNQCCEQFFSVK